MSNNVFPVHDEFFVIDSNNLAQTATMLRGYVITETALIEDAAQLQGRFLPPEGAYVYVERLEDRIRIRQDFLGSYGLYLFREGDYFALSNSFLLLLDHIKHTHRITFNREFANYFLPAELCSASLTETLVNEITLLDRSATVEIRIPSGEMDIQYTDFRENTVPLTSEDGIRLLDRWFRKWTGIVRSLHAQGADLQFALTGGFDSRMTFTILLGSGIDMSGVFVHSIHDDIHTHSEDYTIASRIGAHYGFPLNNTDALCPRMSHYTADDSVNLSFYTKLGFHKQMYHQFSRFEKPRIYFGGAGGESVRAYWKMNEEEYIQKALNRIKTYPVEAQPELEASLRRVMETTFRQIREKFRSFGRELEPEDMTLNLYRETRCRAHFGKDFIEKYHGGIVKFSPLLDPLLQQLTLCDDTCRDRNLLAAILFDRYCPDLLTFPFDSGRKIDEDTIAYARLINSRHPFEAIPAEPVQPEHIPGRAPLVSSNPPISEEEVDRVVDHIFRSDRVRSTFELLYGQRTYQHIRNLMSNASFHALQEACGVIAVSKVLQDVLANENRYAPTVVDAFRSETAVNPLTRSEGLSLLTHGYLENYVTARLDIQHSGTDLILEDCSDPIARVSWPQWMAKNGKGCSMESKKGELELVFRCVGTGKLNIALRSRDVRDKEKNRIPFWIDLDQVTLNGESWLESRRPIWHDVPLRIIREAEDGEQFRLFVKWEPHDERKCHLPAPVVKEPPAVQAPVPEPTPEEPRKGLLGILFGK